MIVGYNICCVCGFRFSSKLCREEVEQFRREVDMLKSKLSEFSSNILSMFMCCVFKKTLHKFSFYNRFQFNLFSFIMEGIS